MRVALTGFMGAGKTAAGRILAARLDVPFFDLDDEVEREAGRDVPSLFAEEGEAGFRRREREALAHLLQGSRLDRFVLATGGGTMVEEEAARLLRDGALTVWLRVPFEVLALRLDRGERDRRPLFADEARARRLYEQRLEAYGRCDLALDVGAEEGPGEVAARIERWLDQQGWGDDVLRTTGRGGDRSR